MRFPARSIRLLLAIAAVSSFLAPMLFAGQPQKMNYQAFLSDPYGNPVTDGTYSIKFSIYDAATGGNTKWTETQNVTTAGGYFSVELGSVVALADTVFSDSRWLALKVGAQPEMTPRSLLVPVPFAYHAEKADDVPGKSIGRDKIKDKAIGPAQLDTLAVGRGKLVSKSVGKDQIDDKVVGKGHLEDKAVGKAQLDTLAVGRGKLESKAIGRDQIDDKVVGKGHLEDKAVGKAQLDTLAVGRGKLDNKAVGRGQLDNNSVDSTRIEDGTISFDDIGQNGAGNGQVMKWDAVLGWIAANDNLSPGDESGWVDDGGVVRLESADDSVGIGIDAPTEKLEVAGNVQLSGFIRSGLGSSSITIDGVSGGIYPSNGAIKIEQAAAGIKMTVGPGHINSGAHSSILGGLSNTIHSDRSVIGGGGHNTAGNTAGTGPPYPGEYATVGGGEENQALSPHSTVGGGDQNTAGLATADSAGEHATVAGGSANIAQSRGATVGGGSNNIAGVGSLGPPYSGEYATIGGGRYNRAAGMYSVVCGGGSDNLGNGNQAFSNYSTISGGGSNTAGIFLGAGPPLPGEYATVSGGHGNEALTHYSTVGGGDRNIAGDILQSDSSFSQFATVSGGRTNLAMSQGATVGGGIDNHAGSYDATGEEGRYATVSGGARNRAKGSYSVVGGGGEENSPNGNQAVSGWSVVGGGKKNISGIGDADEEEFATIGGGAENQAYGRGTTIGGGYNNFAGSTAGVPAGAGATIGGGSNNRAHTNATVSGGSNNSAMGSGAAIGGGSQNEASASYATIPGGRENSARGSYSFAAGTLAKARHDGSVVISANAYNNPGDSVWTNRDEQMVLRADQGFYLTDEGGPASYNPGKFLITSTGAYLSAAGQWTDVSDKNLKENFTDVDREKLLDDIASLPITRWNYKLNSSDVTHIGPVAQDFHAVLGIGNDDKTIAAADMAGIALAAIQELHKKTQTLEKQSQEIETLKKQIEDLTKLVETLLENTGSSR